MPQSICMYMYHCHLLAVCWKNLLSYRYYFKVTLAHQSWVTFVGSLYKAQCIYYDINNYTFLVYKKRNQPVIGSWYMVIGKWLQCVRVTTLACFKAMGMHTMEILWHVLDSKTLECSNHSPNLNATDGPEWTKTSNHRLTSAKVFLDWHIKENEHQSFIAVFHWKIYICHIFFLGSRISHPILQSWS